MLRLAPNLLFVVIGFSTYAQDLITEITDSTKINSDRIFLYSDSSFAYVRGTKRNLLFTTGTYRTIDTTIQLTPFEKMPSDIRVEWSTKRSCSKEFSVVFFAGNGEHFESKYSLVLPGTVKKWTDEYAHSHPHWIDNHEVREVSEKTLLFEKPDCNEYELALTGLYRLLNQMYHYRVHSDVHHVEVHSNIQLEVAKIAAAANSVIYEDIKEAKVVIGDQEFLVN